MLLVNNLNTLNCYEGVIFMNDIDLVGQLGDLKEIDYRNTLAIATLIEILVEKGIITLQEFSRKSYYLDNMSLEQLKQFRTGI